MNNEHYIGKIVATFGIKGELKVYSESDFLDFRFRNGAKIILRNGKTTKEVEVTSSRVHKQYTLITVNHLNDINLVLNYVGSSIYSLENPPLEEDEFYVEQLIGMSVFNENNEFLGKINDVINIPSNDILEIVNDLQKILIPFVDEYIVEITEEKVIIKEIEGFR